MKLKKLAPDHADITLLNKLYLEAFPPNERLLSMEEIFALEGRVPLDILGIYPDENPEQFAGFFMVLVHEKFVYLLFFATCAHMRSTGIGSKAIKALVDTYEGKPSYYDNHHESERYNDRYSYTRRRNPRSRSRDLEIIFESWAKAEEIRDTLWEILDREGVISVSQLNYLAELEDEDYTDTSWGWRDISTVTIHSRSDGRAVLVMPRPEYILER
mgnify:CR=1 FL=1